MPIATLDFSQIPEEQELTEDYARFVTRANVVWNIRRWAEKTFGQERVAPAMVAHIRDHLKSRNRRPLAPQAERLLRVAWQTELAGRIPEGFGDSPDLRRVAALTLPVQTYYSMFNGLRALTHIRGSAIDSHTPLHRDFAESGVNALPAPWGVTLSGEPAVVGLCSVNPPGFVAPYAFNAMERHHEAEAYVFAALRMTRRWKFAAERQQWLKTTRKKDGSAYKRLPPGQPQKIVAKMRPTTLFDFVYELRCKAHYQSVDEYTEEYGQDIIDRFHYGMTFLADTGLLIAEAQIASYTGFDALIAAADRWAMKPRGLGAWATETLDRRMSAIEAYGSF